MAGTTTATDSTTDNTGLAATEGGTDGTWLGRAEGRLERAKQVGDRVSRPLVEVVGFVFLLGLLQVAITSTLTWTWSPGRTAFTVTLALLCLWTLAFFASPGFRNGYLKGADSPVVIIAVVVAMAITAAGAAFAGVTRMTLDWTGDSLSSGADKTADVTPGKLIGFYYWHLFNALPGSPSQTLKKIATPYEYTSHWVGVYVLTYSTIVVVPILAWIGALLHWRRVKPEPADQEHTADPESQAPDKK